MRRLALLLMFFTALAARPCGPDFPFATFVLTSGPDGDYALYAAGHLGVPQTAYRTRHLVLAWDYLTHRPLSPAEQHEAALANQHFLRYDGPNQVNSDATPDAIPQPIQAWFATRTAFGPLPASAPHTPEDTTIATNKMLPGNTYQTFSNCLDDAYLTATRTLTTRIAAYGKANPAVADWVTGQDAVFSNCGGDKNPTLPSAAPANAPLWLQQDRAYQLAAAHFYALDYDTAITQFRAIAADTTSPWSPIARYLVARTIIRKASVADDQLTYPQGTTAQQQAALSQYRSTLTLAKDELLSLRDDPKQAALHNAANDLLDYVNLRLQPDQQAQVLAARLQAPHPHHFGQALIDLTWLRTNPTDPTLAAPLNTPRPGPSELLAWLNDITACDRTPNAFDGTPSPHTPADCTHAQTDILTHYRSTHATVWLLAALMVAQPSDPSTQELLTAAASVPATDPGYTAITYHRLRLSPRTPATRSQLLTLLPTLDKPNASTTNLFTALNAASAPTLDDFLRSAPRRPADETSMIEQGEDVYPAPTEDVCGTRIAPNTTLLFDADAAIAFNQQLPLRLLAASAESTILPTNLRYQVAQSAWARAVLLDQPAIARRMAPILIACRPAWKPVLDAYNASTTPDDLHANGQLALMRFASTEPSVRQGEERRNGFATYDSFRQNWWCMAVPQPGGTVDDFPTFQFHSNYGPQVLAQHPPPPFLTPADLAEATTEADQLRKIPSASTYFATQALAWMKAHAPASPKADPRTPDILGEADRVLRNSCRTERPYDATTGQPTGDPNNPLLTANLAHALFDALHNNYPASPWTRRYKTWQ
jgi:hypothetical protein